MNACRLTRNCERCYCSRTRRNDQHRTCVNLDLPLFSDRAVLRQPAGAQGAQARHGGGEVPWQAVGVPAAQAGPGPRLLQARRPLPLQQLRGLRERSQRDRSGHRVRQGGHHYHGTHNLTLEFWMFISLYLKMSEPYKLYNSNDCLNNSNPPNLWSQKCDYN